MGNVTFERPPLNEVSFGLSFAPLSDMRTSHYGAFWSRLRPDFDQTADKPPVTDVSGKLSQIAVTEWFPLPRVWFIHKNKEELLQLQPNRFYFNWRKVQPNTPYPRFDNLAPLFCKYLETFVSFLKEESLGTPDIGTAELVYVNHIPKGEGWREITDVGEVFPDLVWRPRKSLLGEEKGFAWHGSFRTADVRLEADIKSGEAKDGEEKPNQLFLFELRAVSRKQLQTVDAVRDWFRLANASIVLAFQDLTSERMQKEIWGRVG
jgi:uncharacterized protein (TIGR04255 family)